MSRSPSLSYNGSSENVSLRVAPDNERGVSGRPAKPSRPRYKDERTDAVEVHLTRDALRHEKPRLKPVFDHRVPERVEHRLSDSDYVEIRKCPQHITSSFGVALFSTALDPGTNRDEYKRVRGKTQKQVDQEGDELDGNVSMLEEPLDKVAAKKMITREKQEIERRNARLKTERAKARKPPEHPFGAMQQCLGKALVSTAIANSTRIHVARPVSLIKTSWKAPAEVTPEQETEAATNGLFGNPIDDGFDAFQYSSLLNEDDLLDQKRKQEEQELKRQIAEAQAKAISDLAEKKAVLNAQQAVTALEVEDEESEEDIEAKTPTATEQELLTKKTLFAYVQANKYKKVDEMFLQGVNVNLADEHGNTTLHIACQNGAKKMIKTCLKHNANLNCQNRQQQTPLHYCFAYQYDKIASFLISKGANDCAVNEFGLTCYEGLKPVDS